VAGHSKFANIKHRKSAQDAKRAKSFTKAVKNIVVAAKMGGGDPAFNARLRLAIAAAKDALVTKDKIVDAIKRATGEGSGENLEYIRYNANVNGVAFIVEAYTDNKNRTAGDVRSLFTKNGGVLAETGSVEFGFDHIGMITYARSIASEDEMLEAAIECGANDVETDDESHYITTHNADLHKVTTALIAKFGDPASSALIWQPKSTIEALPELRERIEKIISLLEDNDDVDEVFTNIA
jgi:YebC/PmpR family DNA-binding regulatory protein